MQEDAECPPQEVRVWCGPQPLASPASKSHTALALGSRVSKTLRKAVPFIHINYVTAEVRHKYMKEYKHKI